MEYMCQMKKGVVWSFIRLETVLSMKNIDKKVKRILSALYTRPSQERANIFLKEVSIYFVSKYTILDTKLPVVLRRFAAK